MPPLLLMPMLRLTLGCSAVLATTLPPLWLTPCGSRRLPHYPGSHRCHRGRHPGHLGLHPRCRGLLGEEVCSTGTVATQGIEYERVCREIVDVLCYAPVAAPVVAHCGGREADAEG